MTGLVVVSAVLGAAAVFALVVDQRDRRHGAPRRSIRDVSTETMHHRVDMDAVPYEPARHAGQRDWATYRRRDRKREH